MTDKWHETSDGVIITLYGMPGIGDSEAPYRRATISSGDLALLDASILEALKSWVKHPTTRTFSPASSGHSEGIMFDALTRAVRQSARRGQAAAVLAGFFSEMWPSKSDGSWDQAAALAKHL